MPQLNWDNVRFIITVDIDGHRWVDIFEPHATLTYNQYRLRSDGSIQFCGVNEPNESSGRRHNVRGSKARQVAEDWVRGSSAPSRATSSSSDSSTKSKGSSCGGCLALIIGAIILYALIKGCD